MLIPMNCGSCAWWYKGKCVCGKSERLLEEVARTDMCRCWEEMDAMAGLEDVKRLRFNDVVRIEKLDSGVVIPAIVVEVERNPKGKQYALRTVTAAYPGRSTYFFLFDYGKTWRVKGSRG